MRRAQFLEDVRHVMGLPEWMLSIDSRKTKALHGGACIQMLVHFRGGQAHNIEKDFTVLISNGRLSDPSIAIPGYVDQKRKHTLSYRTCGVRDPNEKSTGGRCIKVRKDTLNNFAFILFLGKSYRNQFGQNADGHRVQFSYGLVLTMLGTLFVLF